jgi:hypothetical protein
MPALTMTWKEKHIEKEERGSDFERDEPVERQYGQENVEINMVFYLPTEFSMPGSEATRLKLGAERAVFESQMSWGGI